MTSSTIKYFIVTVFTTLVIYRLANAPAARHSVICILTNGKSMCPKFHYTGKVDPGWENIIDDIKSNFDNGYEIGNSIAIWHKGKMVVDATTGYEDSDCTIPYKKDTIQLVFSSTKVWTAVAIAMLVDRGHLDYKKPIADYWPEFAVNGKSKVTISDLMSHAGGLHGVSKSINLATILRDGPISGSTELSSILAETKLDEQTWRQKGNQGYHGLSRGLYANELTKRVDPEGRNIHQFIQDEIVEPLNLDFRIGLHGVNETVRNRVGNIHEQPWWKMYFGLIPRMILPRSLWAPLFDDIFINDSEMQFFSDLSTKGTVAESAFMKIWGKGPPNAPAVVSEYKKKNKWQDILSPSTHGFSSANSFARLGSVMLNGGTDPLTGTILMNNKTVEIASTYYPYMFDATLLKNISYTVGGFGDVHKFAKEAPPWIEHQEDMKNIYMDHQCLGWGGVGGSLFQWCPKQQLAIGYVMNYYSPHIIDWRAIGYLKRALSITNDM